MSAYSAPNVIILLLDSDGSTRGVFREALENVGYLVLAAEDIGVAVDRLGELAPDLLITRPYINGMTGRFAAHYLRTKRPGLPVLIVAGILDDDRLTLPNQAEGIRSFPKPFSREEFIDEVKRVLASIGKKV